MADSLQATLELVASGKLTAADAYDKLKGFEDIGYAKLDHQRVKRKGFPEVIFGEGKTSGQIINIMENLMDHHSRILATRVSAEKASEVVKALPDVAYDETSRTLLYNRRGEVPALHPAIGILCAGTSDLPVAEEAAVTAMAMGNEVKRFYDIGVAGIHRLFHHLEEIESCKVLIVIAGMEGALPSVVGGLVHQPVIAVPTSVGYGANLEGITPLLAMLTSCASGVSVVNINNGFGAAYSASLINQLNYRKAEE
ncbi:nickel pincer cofactor biosynthesis protein LarB [Evansella sp. LMS18]|uniref:nickel pincer cofactor biosynthesis protein LarB n=1 Tax=Evansella sp. LMS18 TaxID=2924033 RepID=UPI0020D164B6|nr:nickel pincer cofactor biosynthesis protein LarB [Evansella sp. LMS18]UTR11923.1 nickel pincer cofactor biosynthesis protein LarB [Evansella sp. LMS18]